MHFDFTCFWLFLINCRKWCNPRRMYFNIIDTHSMSKSSSRRCKFVGYYSIIPQEDKNSGCWIFQLLHWFKENLLCSCSDLLLYSLMYPEGLIKTMKSIRISCLQAELLTHDLPNCNRNVNQSPVTFSRHEWGGKVTGTTGCNCGLLQWLAIDTWSSYPDHLNTSYIELHWLAFANGHS